MKIILKNHKGKLYAGNVLPENSILAGEVSEHRIGTGALVYIKRTDLLVKYNAGVIKQIDQRTAKAEILKAWQKDNGMTQEQVAEVFGVSPAAVASWSSGRRQISGAAWVLLREKAITTG